MNRKDESTADPFFPCPACGSLLSRGAERCPVCRERPSSAAAPAPPGGPPGAREVPPPDPELARLVASGELEFPSDLRPNAPVPEFDLGWPMLIVGGGFLVVYVLLHVLQWLDYRCLLRDGVVTTGVVTDQYANEENQFFVEYKYVLKTPYGRVPFKRTREVAEDFYYTLTSGQPVEVVYLPSRPHISALAAHLRPPRLRGSRVVEFLVILAICGTGIYLLYQNSKLRQMSLLLQREGLLATGIVFARQKVTIGVEYKRTFHFVAFVFRPAGGAEVITKAEDNEELYDLVRSGSAVVVRYLPAQPAICRLEGPL